MKEKLEKRLAELKQEYESGKKMILELETKQSNLRDTLLRISGAMQILEEALSEKIQESSEISPETKLLEENFP